MDKVVEWQSRQKDLRWPDRRFRRIPTTCYKLLEDCHRGVLQLPDFQRSWVWDEDRIKSLIASVSRAFPVGALMTLDTGGPVNFKPRPIEGAPPEAKDAHAAFAAARWPAADDFAVSGHPARTRSSRPSRRRTRRSSAGSTSTSARRWTPPSTARRRSSACPRIESSATDFGREVVLDLSTPREGIRRR